MAVSDDDVGADRAPRFACDAMCGGLVRRLRSYGYDATYTEGIEDGDLVDHAEAEGRVLISADGPLFARRKITTARVRALRLPRGLQLREQITYVVTAMRLRPREARCARCNGRLRAVTADDVADRIPARSLIYATEFYLCDGCDRPFWNGTHWHRIIAERERLGILAERSRVTLY